MSESSADAKRQQIDAMYQKSRRSFPEVPELTAEEFMALRDKEKVLLVDVRTDEERAVSMIPGAITLEQFEQQQAEYKDTAVAVYCTIGHRSGHYAKQLHAGGWRVFNLKGAILSWTHADGSLENADGPTRKVHVNNPRCDLVADGYESVW